MSKAFATFRQIIGAWPSLGEFAKDIGVKENTAKLMRFRDSISADYWADLVDAAKERGIKGISTDLLARLLAEKKVPADSAAA